MKIEVSTELSLSIQELQAIRTVKVLLGNILDEEEIVKLPLDSTDLEFAYEILENLEDVAKIE